MTGANSCPLATVRVTSSRPFGFLLFSFFILLFFSSAQAHADGVSWLESNVNIDGSVGVDNGLSTSFQSTAETVRAFHELENAGAALIPGAVQFMNDETFHNTENLSRKIIMNVEQGQDVTAFVDELITHQNQDGGFGGLPGYDSTAIDTAFALQAIAIAGQNSSQAAGLGISYLLSQQDTDGSWALYLNNPSVYVTSQANIALQKYLVTFNVSNEVNAANDFLIAAQIDGGGWGSPFETALALIAVAPITLDSSLYFQSIETLRNEQLANSSWNNDVYETALSLRALNFVENIPTPVDPTLASLTGLLVNEITGAPIEGVTVSLGAGNPEVTTEGDGKFNLPNIAPGSYTVTYSLAGYNGATQSFDAVAGQFLNLGTIRLTQLPDPNLASVFGKVISSTGEPISGATISLGAGNPSITTGADGQFYLTDLTPSDYTIDYSALGYQVVTQSINTVAGQALNVGSVRLAPDSNVAVLSGLVSDAATNQPIAGATIQLAGVANSSITTNANGTYGTSLAPGAYTITVSASGYDSVVVNTSLTTASRANFSPALYATGTSPTEPEVSLVGQVFDFETQQPLGNALVRIVGQTVEGSTGSNGAFELSGVQSGEFSVEITADGYQTISYSMLAPAGSKLNVGSVYMLRENEAEDVIALSGLVIEEGTTNPVVGAQVKVDGTTLSATTGPDGFYEISGISQLNFKVLVSAGGYLSTFQDLSFTEFSASTFDVSLKRASVDSVEISDLSTDRSSYPAYTAVQISATLSNDGDATRSVQLLTEILDPSGQVIHKPNVGLQVGAGGAETSVTLATGESQEIHGQWFTGIKAPGVYQIRTRVRDKFSGQELSQRVSLLTIEPTQSITSVKLTSTPQFANLGAMEQVVLKASITNRSNIENALQFSFSLNDPDGNIIRTGQATVSMSPDESSKSLELESFPHTFTSSGEHPVTVNILSGVTPDEIQVIPIRIAPSVRVEPSQDIDTTTIVPNSDKRIKIDIRIQGVQQQ